MITKQRYKIFSKNYFPLACIPKDKILKFYRPKWKQAQKLILKDKFKKKKLIFKNFGNVFSHSNRWERISQTFRKQLVFKKKIQILFFNIISNSIFKNIYLHNLVKFSYLQSLFYKFEYRIDILLLRVGVFNCNFLIKKNIQKKKILINNKKITILKNLSKGSIISILNLKKIFFKNRLLESFFLHTFIEIDFYTNQIIIIKNLQDLTKKDFFMLSRDFYNILDLRAYLLG